MQLLVIISQTFLYLCFSILMGSFLLGLVPSTYRPAINHSRRLLVLCTAGIPLFAFIPVLQVILYLAPRLGAKESALSVLTGFTIGKAWGWTLVLAVGLLLAVGLCKSLENAVFNITGAVLTFLLIVTIAWSSHASSIDLFSGFLGDVIHLLAMSVWTGILIIISWRAVNTANWRLFLTWFTPVAILCFTVVTISGLVLMNVLIDDYTSSWTSSYGQGLLFKHLFVILLLFYAGINGFWVKRKLKKDPGFNPIQWVRLESIVIFLIFSITAAFSQLSPPTEGEIDDPSKLFMLTYGKEIPLKAAVQLEWNGIAILFLLLAGVCSALLAAAFSKEAPRLMVLLLSGVFVFCLYLALMASVVLV